MFIFEYFTIEADRLQKKEQEGRDKLAQMAGVWSQDQSVINVQKDIAWAMNSQDRMQMHYSEVKLSKEPLVEMQGVFLWLNLGRSSR